MAMMDIITEVLRFGWGMLNLVRWLLVSVLLGLVVVAEVVCYFVWDLGVSIIHDLVVLGVVCLRVLIELTFY